MKTTGSSELGKVLKNLRPNNSDSAKQQSAEKQGAAAPKATEAVVKNISAAASESAKGTGRSPNFEAVAKAVRDGTYEIDNEAVAKSLINELGIGDSPILG